MSFDIFSGDHWTVDELTNLLKQLELAYASGARQATFKDQTLIYSNKTEMAKAIESLRKELMERGELGGSSEVDKTKRIRVQTKSKGF